MMQKFTDNGAKVKNGLEMLHLQADKAWGMVKS
jgi:shikimate 5-dehydrogenase